jgi:Rrf2 family iron-sulfur cluster assembly transcriptional regulator
MTHELWANLNAKMVEYLDSVTCASWWTSNSPRASSRGGAGQRAISSQPVVKPIRVTAPNSVFALGGAFS